MSKCNYDIWKAKVEKSDVVELYDMPVMSALDAELCSERLSAASSGASEVSIDESSK